MTFRIREARPEEYEAIADLTVDAFQEYASGITTEEWEAYVADLRAVNERSKGATILVAEEDGSLAGAVTYYGPGVRETQWFPPEYAWFRVLAVPPSKRGRGIGRMLTEECIRRARQDKAEALGLHTTHLMSVARAMYEAMGFQIEQEFEVESGYKFWQYALLLTDSRRSS